MSEETPTDNQEPEKTEEEEVEKEPLSDEELLSFSFDEPFDEPAGDAPGEGGEGSESTDTPVLPERFVNEAILSVNSDDLVSPEEPVTFETEPPTLDPEQLAAMVAVEALEAATTHPTALDQVGRAGQTAAAQEAAAREAVPPPEPLPAFSDDPGRSPLLPRIGEADSEDEDLPLPAAEEPEEEAGDDEDSGRRRRRKRDPFQDMGKVSSQDASISPRQLSTLSQIKKIKRARVRHEGKRIVTDDVKKLKSLAIEPRLPLGEFINYYVEPVRIEYYIPKESRFAVEEKFMYIPLIDPEPREQDEILKECIEQNRFVDLIDVMNEHPRHITDILEAYNNSMHMFESLSKALYDADTDEDLYRTAFYLTETLADYEPSLATLEFMGDFIGWNLNWLIRKMNSIGVELSAQDKTVAYFIKLRNVWWEENNYDYDERFEILAALFYEQAFPNRITSYGQDDYIYGAFDR